MNGTMRILGGLAAVAVVCLLVLSLATAQKPQDRPKSMTCAAEQSKACCQAETAGNECGVPCCADSGCEQEAPCDQTQAKACCAEHTGGQSRQ